MTLPDLSAVAAQIVARPAVGPTRIIGVDGPAGAGKSMVASRLQAALPGSTLVEVDDFVSWPDPFGWWPRFERDVLKPLASGRDAHYQVRDWAHDEFGTSLGPWKTAQWAPVVVVEGVTCTRRAAVPLLTYAIWVDAPADVRLSRGVQRDGEDYLDLWLQWMEQERSFFAADRTRERADLRIGEP